MVVFFVLSLKDPLFIESQYQKRVFTFNIYIQTNNYEIYNPAPNKKNYGAF